MNKKIQKFKWYDIGILKFVMICIGILLVILIPKLLLVQWRVYAIIALVGAIYLWSKMLCKKK